MIFYISGHSYPMSIIGYGYQIAGNYAHDDDHARRVFGRDLTNIKLGSCV